MNRNCLIFVIIVSIGATCRAWSQEDKFDSNTHSASSTIEDKISVRDTDQIKVTAKPLQVRVDEEPESESRNQKNTRTSTLQPIDNKGPSCCSQNLGNVLSRSESNTWKINSDNERDKNQRYGHYQDERRYGWQSSSYPTGPGDNSGRHGNYERPYAGSQTTSDRYQRPPYGSDIYNQGGDKANLNFGGSGVGNKFPGLSGSSILNKFGAIGNKFSALGNKFSALGNKYPNTGDKYGGVNYGETEYGRPGYYGSSAGYGDGHEFGTQESAFGEGSVPATNHLATQQAVALKALAGVALIGAAAALATNPVLLPIGVLSGRKKRDVNDHLDKESTDFPLRVLKNYVSKNTDQNFGSKLAITPNCVARLACEVQKDYITDLKNHEDILKEDKSTFHSLEHWFMNLVQKNILDADYVDGNMKKLIKLATLVGSEGRNCAVFTCSLLAK
ncbi:uncharacterized protein LOC117167403 [Belonocnema kinseyi]|uniref:uncharacterized protein LOC117167403 n=1 Tax=Belonocnema kinseyi TaxID=2817044 RepID=UPI00143D55A9|nr:uncharacterized protein LOC117167403 [Belonocnema kinseyi]